MLAQIADHCRIVSPTPTDAYVKQRREAAENLISDQSLAIDLLEAFVEFAVFGVPSTRDDRHKAATTKLIDAIREVQPSFASDVDANLVDLRLVASVVVGERLQASPSGEVETYMASLIISALLLPPMPQELYLARLLKELVELARASLDHASRQLRERRPWPNKAEVEIAGADAAAIAKSAKSAFDALLEAVTINAKADREELEVLWWVFGGRSARTGDRFESMAEGERAFRAAIELSDMMLMPPIPTAQYLLGSLVPGEVQLSLAKVVEQLRKETLSELASKKDAIGTVLKSHSALLPLSWLSGRLLESDFSPGWQPEFERKTKLKADTPAALGDWARQALAECVAQRLAMPLLGTSDK